MGLDVRVYINIKIAENPDKYNFKAYTLNPSWNWKIKNLVNKEYYTGDTYSHHISYPYSSHNELRRSVCAMLGQDPKSWERDDFDLSLPFSEWLDFADNEGVLDWEVSEKLYRDFVRWEHIAYDKLNAHQYQSYINWAKVFREASENKGAVVYR